MDKRCEVLSTTILEAMLITVEPNGSLYEKVGEVGIRTKRWIKDMGLLSTKTKIRNVRELKPGDHISYPTSISRFMKHHAIVIRIIDDDTVEVIHYSRPPSDNPESTSSSSSASWRPFSSSNKSQIMIRKGEVNLSKHVSKKKLYRVDYGNDYKCFPPDKVIARAERKIDQPGFEGQGYNLFKNNCEHFASWCKTDQAFSKQVRMIQIRKPIAWV